MKYVSVTAEELEHLREGLKIIESLNEYDNAMEIYFYGLTDNSVALEGVKMAVASDDEIDEADVNVTEAVLVFPLSADILYYLTGSGFYVDDGEAVYIGGNDGPRTVNMKRRDQRRMAKLTAGAFKKMALARDDFSGEDFLMQYGSVSKQPAPQEIPRTEPATTEGQVPAAPTTGREAVAPAKKSSLNFNLEGWLG